MRNLRLAKHYHLSLHVVHVIAHHEVLPRTVPSFKPDKLVGDVRIVLHVDLIDLGAIDRARISVLVVEAQHFCPEKEIGAVTNSLADS